MHHHGIRCRARSIPLLGRRTDLRLGRSGTGPRLRPLVPPGVGCGHCQALAEQQNKQMSWSFAHKLLAVAAGILTLGGQHAEAAPRHRNALCANDDVRPWARSRPPANARAYRDVADARPYYRGLPHAPQNETWYVLPTHEVMLCRTGNRTFCEAEWWQFGAGAVEVASQSGTLCVPNE